MYYIMWLLSWLLKATVNVVTLPLSVVGDVVDAVTEDNNPRAKTKTEKKLEKLWDNIKDTFDWDLL